MSRKLIAVAPLAFALALSIDALAGDAAIASPFVTKDFVNLRDGPGTGWPLLAVIPPSTSVEVDYCSATSLIGWCEVTYEGQTGYAHGSLLRRSTQTSFAKGRTAKAKPRSLVQAERRYEQARTTAAAARQTLDRLLQIEARRRQLATDKTGSWIEPTALWREKVAAERNLAHLRKVEGQARATLYNEIDKAR